jgi:hypothetical protein
VSDYTVLTDAEINRRIAQALGYRVEWRESGSFRIIDDPYESYSVKTPGYVLIDPKGVQDDESHDTEDEAWCDAPDWFCNIVWNPIELLDGCKSFIIWKNTYTAENNKEVIEYSIGIEGSMDNHYRLPLARAICEAWLAWKEAAK